MKEKSVKEWMGVTILFRSSSEGRSGLSTCRLGERDYLGYGNQSHVLIDGILHETLGHLKCIGSLVNCHFSILSPNSFPHALGLHHISFAL